MSWHRLPIVLLQLGIALGNSCAATALEVSDGTDSIRSVEQWWREFPEMAGKSRAEKRLLVDAADGVLNEMSLLRAALVSSGVTEQQRLAEYEGRFRTMCRSLAAGAPRPTGARQRAQYVLRFLHGALLNGRYDAASTRIDVALDQGRFNCVSSAILYCCLAEHLGLEAHAVQLPGHVRCVVNAGSGEFVVEPTCASWFDVMDNRQDRQQLVRQTTGYSRDSSADVRRISPIQLVAMVYYNDGIERLKVERTSASAASNLKALALDSTSEIIQGNLLAAINNWALELAQDQQFEDSADLLQRGLRLAPRYEHFLQNDIYVHQHWMDELWSSGRFDEAQLRLTLASRRRPDVEYFTLARLEGFRREAAARLAKGDVAGAVDVFEAALACELDQWHAMEAGLWNGHALKLARNDDYEAALECFDLGLERLPDNALLDGNRHATIARWVTSAYQQGDYSEGVRRCRLSFGSAPAPTTLQDHLRYGYHHWLETLAQEGRTADAHAVLHEAASVLPKDNLWQEWQSALSRKPSTT